MDLATILTVVLPPLLAALATYWKSRQTSIDAKGALEAAKAAADIVLETAINLAKNTAITVETKAVATDVQTQTNGIRERQEALLAATLEKVESMSKTIGILQGKLIASEETIKVNRETIVRLDARTTALTALLPPPPATQ